METTASRQEKAAFLTPEDLVARWQRAVTIKTLRNWRAMGRGPKFVVIGGKARYPLDRVEAWEKLQHADESPPARNTAGPGGGDVRTR